jgi:phage terminase Nu1 subunit (DNA packaging protein)
MNLKITNLDEDDASPSSPILVDSKKLASLLDVSLSHVTELRRRYDLPTIHLGGSVRFDLNEVKSWISNRKPTKGKRRR